MIDGLLNIAHTGAAALMAALTMAGTFLTQSRVMVVIITPPPPETAIVATASVKVVSPTSSEPEVLASATSTAVDATSTRAPAAGAAPLYPTFQTPFIKAGLLPAVAIVSFTSSSTVPSSTKVLAPAAPPKPATAAKPVAKPAATVKPAPAPATIATPTSTPLPSDVTAQWILDRTTTSFTQKLDGTYRLAFVTDLGGTQKLNWDLRQQSIGGSNGLPIFDTDFLCDPAPRSADPAALDQNPSFAVRTAYTCTVALTPRSGADQRKQSKDFSFTTGVGRVVVTPASSMDTLLHNDQNNGGFQFTNQENDPVTVTGLTMDVSYTGLVTLDGPLVLRIVDPVTGTSLFDFHMEDIAADSSSSYTHTMTGVPAPITFIVPGNTARLLPFEVLGVHRQLVTGVDPTVTITLRVATVTPSDTKTTLNSAIISWSCVVGAYSFDPNATDMASAQACRN